LTQFNCGNRRLTIRKECAGANSHVDEVNADAAVPLFL
jgi:hypothetical protein